MHHACSLMLLPALAWLVATPAAAQTSAVVPAVRAQSEGNTDSYFPFVYDAGRNQMVVEGAAFCNAIAMVDAIAFRRDGLFPGNFQAVNFPRAVVTVGHAASGVTPATMSTTFAANRGPGSMVVHDAALNLPPLPPSGSPAPFNVVIPFSSQFLYQRATGELLIEFEFPGQAQAKQEYVLDAEIYRASQGSVSRFGASGPVQAGDRLLANASVVNLAPGGSAANTLTGMSQNYPVVHWVGSSNTSFGGLPLPHSLASIGAPSNFLYTSMALVVTPTVTGSGTRFTSSYNWPIPADPVLGGAVVYAQWAIVDPASSLLGLVTTNGVALTLAPGAAAPVLLNLIYTENSATPAGNFLYGANSAGGPVLQLRGIIG